MEIIPYLLFLVGCVFIIKGGDFFVEAAIWIARVTGISEVLIGATVVSVGTTLPELTVSVISSYQGMASMAIGNAVGSTICNVGLVLAISCIIRPSRIQSRFFHLKGIILIVYTLLVWKFSVKGEWLSAKDGWLMLLLFLVYLTLDYIVVKHKASIKVPTLYKPGDSKEWRGHLFRFVVGLVLILIGAQLLIKYGIEIARFWGVPEGVIALTIISIGTSLPELVTTLTAAMKGHENLSVGNILGANIFNLTLVLGASALAGPLSVSRQSIVFDIPISLFLAITLVVPGIITKTISRLRAFILLAGYVTYLAALFFVYG
ncbi:MAG: calcium/sodium antiporter [Clostridiales bacterium]|nr:calcium/sodium antiporter [Clostridiales bacterium]